MLDDNARFAPAETVSWNDAGEELVLFEGVEGRYFAFNRSAVETWRELLAGRSVNETIDALAARFDSPRAAIADDVTAFIRAAHDRGLLVAAR